MDNVLESFGGSLSSRGNEQEENKDAIECKRTNVWSFNLQIIYGSGTQARVVLTFYLRFKCKCL